MCSPGESAVPSCAADAAAMAQAGLAWLAGMDAGSVPAVVLADCLRALEQAESMHTAARASVLAGSLRRVVRRMTGTGQRGPG